MKCMRIVTCAAGLAVGLAASQAWPQSPLGTAFTFQGQLKEEGGPANGEYDFVFRLFDASSGPAQIGGDWVVDDWPVNNGLFTVQLDFGAGVFTGDALWLEVGVRVGDSSDDYITLSPRQPVTAAPYAAYALDGPGGVGPWDVNGDHIHNTNAGNVGIGIDSPSAMLQVLGEVRAGAGPGNVTIGDASPNGLGMAVRIVELHLPPDPPEFWNADVCYDGDQLSLLTGTSSGAPSETNGLIIKNSGRVGIGTATPGARLTVTGVIESTSGGVKFPDGSIQTTAPADPLWHSNGSNVYYNGGDVGIGTDTPAGQLALGAYQGGTGPSWVESYEKQLVLGGEHNTGFNTGDSVKLLISDHDNEAGADIYPIYVEDENNWVHFYLRSIDGIRRTYFGGDVGIGTNLPSNPLSVAGDADVSGNLGIAAPNPEVRLHVLNGTDSALSGGGFLQLGSTTGRNLSLDDNEIMVRDNGGTSTLHINRDGGNTIFSEVDGNVGIGTAAPETKLHVAAIGGIGIKSSGGSTGVDATGTDVGGEFRDATNSGYARLGAGDYGVRAGGDMAGGYFYDGNSGSAKAWLGFRDDEDREWGIQAEGNKGGGRFFDADGSGEARVAYNDPEGEQYGVWAGGRDYGGHFEATATGRSGTGVWASGSYVGGYFKDTNNDSWAEVGTDDDKIRGNGDLAFVQNHPYDRDRVIVYTAPEGDEAATYTRGTARLVDGKARVPLGDTFKWVTNPDIGLTAHLTPRGEAVALAVVSLTTEDLVVCGPNDGPEDVVFDYLVYGLRIGFEERSVVREKEREARIPSMAHHRERYAKYPEFRKYNPLERFKSMRTAIGARGAVDLTGSHALRDAIVEFDPAVHRPSSVKAPGASKASQTGVRSKHATDLAPTQAEKMQREPLASGGNAAQQEEIARMRVQLQSIEAKLAELTATIEGEAD